MLHTVVCMHARLQVLSCTYMYVYMHVYLLYPMQTYMHVHAHKFARAATEHRASILTLQF